MTTNPPTPPRGGTPCREMLAAIGDALRIPAPATHADEISYHRLRSQRATIALEAINRVLRTRDPADLTIQAGIIREHIAGLPATIYDHNGLGS